MKTKVISLDEAIGLPLSHDLTQILPEKGYKEPRFKKGHIVTEDDLPVLRSMGRENLAMLELDKDDVHENDAALRLSKVLTGGGIEVKGPDEGRCSLIATRDGLLMFDEEIVDSINEDDEWIFATLPPKVPVKKGEIIASFRIRPLVVKEEQVTKAEKIGKAVKILPFLPLKIGIVTTGRELAEGRIKDAFRPKMEKKADFFGGKVMDQKIVTDNVKEISKAINSLIDKGMELIICTGGMSVDVDDLTPAAIRKTSNKILFQGVPALPGSMLMLGIKNNTAIVGAPACVVHDEWTTLDLLLQYLFAGLRPTGKETRKWGVGGLCRRCNVCIYPNCTFASRL